MDEEDRRNIDLALERRKLFPLLDQSNLLPHLAISQAIRELSAPSIALREKLLPITVIAQSDLLKWQRDWKALSIRINPVLAELSRSATQFAKTLAPVLENLRRTTELFKPIFEEFYRREAEARRVERTGWLPHSTAPFDDISDPTLTDEEVAGILERHYVGGWHIVRAAFEERLGGYDIDDSAKAAMIEALDSHEAGHYRSTVALLFNEIERVVRRELYGGATGGIASLPKLHDAAGDMALSEIQPSGMAGMRLFRRLVDHLYVHVKTAEDVSRLEADPVPNRHAATHGLVVYNTRQNSLNTLIMADYVFQVITLTKARAAEGEGETGEVE